MHKDHKQAFHFSGLNGLRAIAALSVLFSHTTLDLKFFGLDSHILGTNADGNPKTTLLAGFGVSIFFALSGFLITFLLLKEKTFKEINIKHFYIRRILRIWPLYYLYFGFTILTLILFDLPIQKHYVLFYVFLLANVPFIFGTGLNFLGHYWSLGVEEQFYSFWPWLIKKSGSIKTLTIFLCLTLITIKCILRVVDIHFNAGHMSLAYDVLHTIRFQCMLIGAIGAILYFKKDRLFLKVTNNFIAQSFAWIILFLLAINKFHMASVIDNEFICIVTVFLIIGQIEKKNRIFNLDIPFFDFIGKISYGIYVLHPLLIFYLSKVIRFSNPSSSFNYFVVYFSVLACTIIMAFLSYEFFEKRFLRLKENYTTVKSSPALSN